MPAIEMSGPRASYDQELYMIHGGVSREDKATLSLSLSGLHARLEIRRRSIVRQVRSGEAP